ncbi:DEAD/DEAH box helicase family protein [Corynebacterium uterequi]|uniref:Uncharacterized protein n=1 Tax=Corynebacterium uterequi TaxID=1072256 RepID=A0A0G3HG46_9CORY|nr:DEAD/DEAH box helicase family protein [Corynebacterium uterequi]AKK11710.1 hypothetical protein CUTER_08640 [Corynebacterium uterequi]
MTTPHRTNFAFVGLAFPRLLADCRNLEAAALTNPRASAMQARFVADQVVRHVCAFLTVPASAEASFADLAKDPRFRRFAPDAINTKIAAVRRFGNSAAHGAGFIDPTRMARVVQHLYDILVWAAANTSGLGQAALPTTGFDPSILTQAPKQAQLNDRQLSALERQLSQRTQETLQLTEQREQALRRAEQALEEAQRFKKKAAADALAKEELEREFAQLKAQLEEQTRRDLVAAQKDAGQVDTSSMYTISEADTRRDVIDPMLATAGFSRDRGNLLEEYRLPSGARIDYALMGSDGRVLAIVEGKKSGAAPSAGREQARQYADEVERATGHRPVIFYTTGYLVYLWDDALGYPPREVEGYATADELHQIISKRTQRRPLATTAHDTAIAGRPYQEEMIRAVTERFEAGHRRALVVMATGTGKTRVSLALIKLLQRAGWVKNVLFLADRVSLVNQAARAFSALYPEAGVVNLLESNPGPGSIYVSTYPTMMGLLGTGFSPYYFDLIVLDEAHRSIYNRYQRIIDYFDAFLLGLTATPRDEVDHNTYGLFHLRDGQPTGDYSLSRAIDEAYLVPFKAFAATSVVLHSGIAYSELSDEEKIAWDNQEWGVDEDGTPLAAPERAHAAEINATLLNTTTIDLVLTQVLEHAIKVNGADRMGKTIIFARSQQHADAIYRRLRIINPQVSAEVITYQSSRSQALIDSFSATTADSVDVAISVDMLDTGIDVPEVVNLVFFKPVHSQTKFWQMIGRGTRLCPDLFGPGLDKKEFFVFDYCDNLRRFSSEVEPGRTDGSAQRSLSERLFIARIQLLDALRSVNEQHDGLTADLTELLRTQVASVPIDSPLIAPATRPIVEKFRRALTWEALDAALLAEAEEHLASLPFASSGEEEYAKRFDLLIVGMQVRLANDEPIGDAAEEKVRRLARNLLTKTTVPAIAERADMLEEAARESWWESVSVDELEALRRGVRHLIRYVDRGHRNVVTVDVADELGALEHSVLDALHAAGTVVESSLEEKLREFLKGHGDALVLQKIRRAIPLTTVDVEHLEELVAQAQAGNVKDLHERLGVSLPRFARDVVGLDRDAAREAFADLLDGATLNSLQLKFMNQLIEGLVHNGHVTLGELFEAPYNDYGTPLDVFEDNIATVTTLKNRLEDLERRVDPVA